MEPGRPPVPHYRYGSVPPPRPAPRVRPRAVRNRDVGSRLAEVNEPPVRHMWTTKERLHAQLGVRTFRRVHEEKRPPAGGEESLEATRKRMKRLSAARPAPSFATYVPLVLNGRVHRGHLSGGKPAR